MAFALEKGCKINVNVITSPGPCRKVRTSYPSKNGCIVSWEAPEDNGGVEIINYIVEMREPQMPGFAGLGWSLVSSDGTKRMIKAHGSEGREYFFRVTAENKCGTGPSAETKKSTLMADPFVKPMPVRSVKVESHGTNFVELSYDKPEWDGGEPITHYKVLGMKSSSEEWIELAVRESFKTKRARIENGLEEDETWTFAVVAINKAGHSDYSTVGPVDMKTEANPPQVTITTKLDRGIMTIKAGFTLKLTAEITGTTPTVDVLCNDQPLTSGCVNNREGECDLVISGCARKHTGMYKIIATNDFGVAEATCEVVVIDKPSSCVGPIRFVTIL